MIMNNEIDINDVVSYIQYLKKEKEVLLDQVAIIDTNIQKINKALKLNEETTREL